MINLTYGDTSEYAEQAVVAKGEDYVYSSGRPDDLCWYVHNKDGVMSPGCIVGNILHRAGVPLEDLAPREGGVHGLLRSLENFGILKVDIRSSIFLWVAQAVQDNKGSWGIAVYAAQSAVSAHDFAATISE